MYDKLIKDLHEGAEFLECSTPGIKNSFAKMCHDAADAIEELQKAMNFHKFNSEFWEDKYNNLADEKWIPVTERLPVIGEKAICFGKNKYMIGTYGEFGWMFPCYFGGVTHWMPLPEPPEDDE